MTWILGIDDSVNTCDCCGKTHLKYTVVVSEGETVKHYGSVCATKHTGLTHKEILTEVKAGRDGRAAAARKEYHGSTAHVNLEAAKARAHRENIPPGKEFRAYIAILVDEDEIVRSFVARKHGVTAADLL